MSVAACAKKARDCSLIAASHIGDAICALSDAAAALQGEEATPKTRRAVAAGLQAAQDMEAQLARLHDISAAMGKELIEITSPAEVTRG